MPDFFAEFLLFALRFAALWILFYFLHKPATRRRLILAICIMALQFPLCRFLFFASGRNFAISIAADILLFMCLAFLCRAEPSRHLSGFMPPLISALYFNGMMQFINYILSCYTYAFAGALPPSFTLWSYVGKTVEAIALLLWTLFYYRIARNMTAKVPLSFSLLSILTPLAGLAVVAASTNAVQPLLEFGTSVFLYSGLFGTLIIALNMCVFYLYAKLSVAHEALAFARELAETPPVWTPEQGLSSAFIGKFEITPREREVIEAMLLGKTDKEIAVGLNMAVNTVQVHLKRIYRKTGAAGRFALSALVRGWSANRK